MVNNIRSAERSFGNGIKKANKNEKKNLLIVRKSIVARTSIKKGSRISLKNICFKRPGKGISPMKYQSVLGKKSKKHFKTDDIIIL